MRRVVAIALLAGLLCAAPLRAEPMEGVDYVAIPGAPPPEGKIQVIEFFHYGCAVCYRFEPLLVAWLKRLPPDVEFARVPALRRAEWVPMAQLYFTLDVLGETGRLHAVVYRAVHETDVNLGDSVQARAWAIAHGVDGERFDAALGSDEVAEQVRQAHEFTLAYEVRATPTMTVDGRYATSPGITGSLESVLSVVDGLIAKAREARRAGR